MSNNSKSKLIKNIISYIVIAIVFIFMVISILSNLGLLGYKFYDVLTGSMSPTINPGSLIIVKEIDDSEVKEGDVITFKGTSTSNLTTHRVVEVIEKNNSIKFQTKGDANDVLDPMLVDEGLLVGKVVFNVPYMGKVMSFINQYRVVIVVLIIAYLCFGTFYKGAKAIKNKD
ncbi:MAG: signal peptidase I [Clostridium baratii]|uniref:Signal peptidase I n=1 Tax=Clostridium baratii str. Sullivan TaxID=1415775 RepID=A0A0A7FU75_9CLOT|nr:signal peptidase I [Clostridium baratii]AIY82371.1 signal peptidase I [Clostridium baratii str. Sullivan]MBS6007220.1 signal peptidase I [Clostridium baratii]